MIVSPREPVPFSQLVADIETLARTHPGQARETVLAAFGRPRLDRFEREWLDKALLRVSAAPSESLRMLARGELARVLSMVSARSQIRVAS